MSSIIKVQDIQNTSGANIINESSNTITIGASGDTVVLGSGATASGFGGGKIGQVLSTSTTTRLVISTTNTSYTDLGLSQSITCSSASSKVLIIVGIGCNILGGNIEGYRAKIFRDSTDIETFDQVFRVKTNDSAHRHRGTHTIQYLDTVGTTSQVTYKIQVQRVDTNHDLEFQDGSQRSMITLIEVLP